MLLDNLLSTGFDVDIDEENSQQNKQYTYNFSRKVIILKTNMKLCVKIMNNGVWKVLVFFPKTLQCFMIQKLIYLIDA